MSRALLVALTWAAAASATRYMEYSGVRMPQYGASDYEAVRDAGRAAALDDYHGHSPDASASLDYKYEEEIRDNSEKQINDADEAKTWRRPSRKHRELMRPPEETNLDTMNKYNPEIKNIAKYKSYHRFPKHRSRLKNRHSRKEEEFSYGRSMKYDRDRRNDISDIDSSDYFSVEKDEVRGDKSKEFKEDADHFRYKETTPRLIRRKPRDRFVKGRSEMSEDVEDDDARLNRRMIDGRKAEPEYLIEVDGRGGVGNEHGSRYRPTIDDDELSPGVLPLKNPNQKTYENYNDYYDMKRVHSIKNKLPSLLRRSSAMTILASATSSSIVEDLWTFRSAAPPVAPAPGATISTSSSASTATSTLPNNINTLALAKPVNISNELPLSEKSRLSILKKAQRKESFRGNALIKKPPVLLQVTNKMPVVVMVEPPSNEPLMRARDVSYDTPERIERAKKLMRHKLVSGARSIQELTDNWDEVICDYIDVSLLDGATLAKHSVMLTIVKFVLVIVIS